MHQCTVKCTSYLYLCLARASTTVILSFPCVGITFTPTDDHPCLALTLAMLEYSIAYSTTFLLHYRRAIDVPWAPAYLPFDQQATICCHVLLFSHHLHVPEPRASIRHPRLRTTQRSVQLIGCSIRSCCGKWVPLRVRIRVESVPNLCYFNVDNSAQRGRRLGCAESLVAGPTCSLL